MPQPHMQLCANPQATSYCEEPLESSSLDMFGVANPLQVPQGYQNTELGSNVFKSRTFTEDPRPLDRSNPAKNASG